MRLRQAIAKFLNHLRGTRYAPNTCKVFESDLNMFYAHVVSEATDSVLAVTADRIRSFLHRQSAKNLSLSTLNRRKSAISVFCRWGTARRYWIANPADEIERLPRARRLPRPFTHAERERLMALILPEREHVLRALLYYTGLRETPISEIRIQDIEMSATGLWHIRSVGKRGKEQVIPVLPELRAALEGYRVQGSVYLFDNGQGRPIDRRVIGRIVRQWGVAADVPRCTPHRFRHTFATMLLERGVPVEKIQRLLAHADISTTMLYAEVTDASLDAAILALSEPKNIDQSYARPSPLLGMALISKPKCICQDMLGG